MNTSIFNSVGKWIGALVLLVSSVVAPSATAGTVFAATDPGRRVRLKSLEPWPAASLWLWLVLLVAGVSRGRCGDVPDILWALRAGGSKEDIGRQIATDSAGNVLVAGTFQGKSTFGQTSLTNGATYNSFLAKYDAQGVLLWVRGITASRTNIVSSGMAVDPAGNIYLSATTWPGGAALQGQMVSKFDAAGGQLWTRSIPNMWSYTGGKGLALDGTGHIYLAGVASSPDSFETLIITKLDAEGHELWRRSSPLTSGGSLNPVALAVDRDGNCAVTGWFERSSGSASLDFGSIVLNSVASFDVFTVKYDAKGNLLWAASLGTEFSDFSAGVTIDPSGAVYVTGYLGGEADHFFVAKYDTTGNVVWLKQAVGTGMSQGRDIILTRDGNLLVIGVLFPYGEKSMQLDSIEFTTLAKSKLVFLVGYDPVGSLTAATELFHSGDYEGSTLARLAANEGGDIYYTDLFWKPLTLGSVVLSSGGDADMLLAKISGASLGPRLQVLRSGGQLVLAWPAVFSRFVLETTEQLAPAPNWSPAPAAPVVIGDQNAVTVDIGGSAQFFRLRKSQ